MKKYSPLWLLILGACLLFVGAALASCSPDTSAPELQGTASLSQAVASLPTNTPPSPTGGEITAVEFTDTACLDCHSDEEQVKALAVEEEPPEDLSSGPG